MPVSLVSDPPSGTRSGHVESGSDRPDTLSTPARDIRLPAQCPDCTLSGTHCASGRRLRPRIPVRRRHSHLLPTFGCRTRGKACHRTGCLYTPEPSPCHRIAPLYSCPRPPIPLENGLLREIEPLEYRHPLRLLRHLPAGHVLGVVGRSSS